MASTTSNSMSIQTTAQRDMGDAVYYTEGWRTMLESHLSYLLLTPNYDTFTVPANDAYRFEGDLMSLVEAQGIAPYFVFPIMRMNGMRSPSQYKRTMTTLRIPYPQTMDTLRKLYQTTSTKST